MKQSLSLFKIVSLFVIVLVISVICYVLYNVAWQYYKTGLEKNASDYISKSEMLEKFKNVKASDFSFLRLQRNDSISPIYQIVLHDKDGNEIKSENIEFNKNFTESSISFYHFKSFTIIDFQTNAARKRDLYMITNAGIKYIGNFDGKGVYAASLNNQLLLMILDFWTGDEVSKVISYDANGSMISTSNSIPLTFDTFYSDEENNRIVFTARRIKSNGGESISLGQYSNNLLEIKTKLSIVQSGGMTKVKDKWYILGFNQSSSSLLLELNNSLEVISQENVRFRRLFGNSANGGLIFGGNGLDEVIVWDSVGKKELNSIILENLGLKSVVFSTEQNQFYIFYDYGVLIHKINPFVISKSVINNLIKDKFDSRKVGFSVEYLY